MCMSFSLLYSPVMILKQCRFIAATNLPGAVDPALRRPGRIDFEISIPTPDREERFLMLQQVTNKFPLDPSVDLASIADVCQGYTVGDLHSLGWEVALKALGGCDIAPVQHCSGNGLQCVHLLYPYALHSEPMVRKNVQECTRCTPVLSVCGHACLVVLSAPADCVFLLCFSLLCTCRQLKFQYFMVNWQSMQADSIAKCKRVSMADFAAVLKSQRPALLRSKFGDKAGNTWDALQGYQECSSFWTAVAGLLSLHVAQLHGIVEYLL